MFYKELDIIPAGCLKLKLHGLPRDYAKARQWFELAIAKGDAVAQVHLGGLYRRGLGVSQDHAMARQWYERAATQGNAAAQYWIGRLYTDGTGVPQDNVRAYMWYNLAVASSEDPEQKKSFAKDRDWYIRSMTPAQLAEAERLAQQCQAQQFKDC